MDAQIWNVSQMSLAFFFVFFAFFTQSAIEQTVIDSYADRGEISRYAGYYSLSIIYAVFTIANFFAPPIVEKLKAKWSMVIASLFYALFLAGFLFLNETFLYVTSALLGMAAALLWSAQGNYLALNSDEKTAGRNAGIFWAVSQTCLTVGGAFLLLEFQIVGDTATISDASTKVIYGVFFGSSILGVITLALLRTAPSKTDKLEELDQADVPAAKQSHLDVITSSFKLSAEKPMLFMAVVFAVSGIRLTFKSGLFPTAIAFTQRIGGNTKTLLALSTILGGLGQSTAGVLFGVMNKKTRMNRSAIVILGTVILAACLSVIYVTFPRRASLEKSDDSGIFEPSTWIVLVVSFVFGIGDGCWSTQIFAFIVARYADRSAQGFSIFMFFQSLLTCAAFYYGTLLDFHWHIYILAAGTTLGAVCYYMADVVMFREYRQVPTNNASRETN